MPPSPLTITCLGCRQTDRVQQLRRAVQQLPHVGVNVVRTSGLFETSPAYVTDQPRFLNAALLARTTLPPRELLAALKSLEQVGQGEGREGAVR